MCSELEERSRTTHGLVGDLFSRTLNAGRDLKEDTVIGYTSLRRDLTSAGVMTKVVALLRVLYVGGGRARETIGQE